MKSNVWCITKAEDNSRSFPISRKSRWFRQVFFTDAGIPLGSQTVLLKGVNDKPETLMHLFQRCMQIRVRPYYLYQCDPVIGTSHFRTPVERGLALIDEIRGFTSGYAVPAYVIDAPGAAAIGRNFSKQTSIPLITVLKSCSFLRLIYASILQRGITELAGKPRFRLFWICLKFPIREAMYLP